MMSTFLLIFIPIFIAFTAYLIFGDTQFRDDILEDTAAVIGAIIFSAIGSLIVSGILFALYASSHRNSMKTEERPIAAYKLVALDTDKDINGAYSHAFFVGSGYIGEEMYYHFYYDEKGKGIRYIKRRADSNYPKIYIVETTETPMYVKYGKFHADTTDPFYESRCQGSTREVLYIPSGTIKHTYKVN